MPNDGNRQDSELGEISQHFDGDFAALRMVPGR
jgi:hypothetical protein